MGCGASKQSDAPEAVLSGEVTHDGEMEVLQVVRPDGKHMTPHGKVRRSSIATTTKPSERKLYAPPLQYFLEEIHFEEGVDKAELPFTAIRRALLQRWTWVSGVGGAKFQDETPKAPVTGNKEKDQEAANLLAAKLAAEMTQNGGKPMPKDSVAFAVKQVEYEFVLSFKELNALRKHLNLKLQDFHARIASEVVTVTREEVTSLLLESLVPIDDGTNRKACDFQAWFERHSEEKLKEKPCKVCDQFAGGKEEPVREKKEMKRNKM